MRGATLEWAEVLSGVSQGSVLGPVFFLIYVNNIVLNSDSSIKLFADDAKLFRPIKSSLDGLTLQRDLNKLEEWSRKWLLQFNKAKCSVVHFGHFNPIYPYCLNDKILANSHEEKDLGVIVSGSFKFSGHISKTAAKRKLRCLNISINP